MVLAKTLFFRESSFNMTRGGGELSLRADFRFLIFSDIGSIFIKRAMASSSETSAVLKPQVGTENVPTAILMVLSRRKLPSLDAQQFIDKDERTILQ